MAMLTESQEEQFGEPAICRAPSNDELRGQLCAASMMLANSLAL
jgi:hypothetical protein